MKSTFKTLAGNTIIFAIGNSVSLVLAFIMVPFYTKMLSPSDFGISDIIMLMRSDSEKTLDENIEKQIINKLSSKYKIAIDDTVVPDRISHEDRLYNLNETWTKIKENKLVITDRLHGMIFAQITGTPCIVFDNYNNKIKMTCED